MTEPKTFSLLQVVNSIQKTFESRFNRAYWIRAELHKLNSYASGNCSPEFVQKESEKIVAQLNGTIWKATFDNINKRFHEIVKEPIKEGTTILFLARVHFHPTYGVSLLVLDIDPNYSLGALQRERDDTLSFLKKKGLLNKNQQLKFPLLPKRVAIISASSSKGLSDFYAVLEKKSPEYHFVTHLFAAYVQGDQAASSIGEQLMKIEKLKALFDVVVIVRGGGGESGLSCFNNQNLCEQIALFPLPVLTGIGHSTNQTVAELIAFRNGITPTELAEILVRCFDNFANPLKQFQVSLSRLSADKIKVSKAMLNNQNELLRARASRLIQYLGSNSAFIQQRLSHAAQKALAKNNENLNQSKENIIHGVKMMQTHHKQQWQMNRSALKFVALNLTQLRRREWQEAKNDLIEKSEKILSLQKQAISDLTIKTNLLSPESVLRRGFSISLYNNKVIGPTNRPKKGDIITTFTASDRLESTLDKIEKK